MSDVLMGRKTLTLCLSAGLGGYLLLIRLSELKGGLQWSFVVQRESSMTVVLAYR